MTTLALDIATPRWAVPLLAPARFKGAKGGRSSGKSHFFAEAAVERMVEDADLSVVCIREVQKSLKYSAKRLVEKKIRTLGVAHLFTVLETEIRRTDGSGVMIFQGMQDHTAESIKSLEDFGIAWVEEAQSLSKRSLDLLVPTIRAAGSELWFSWNPDQPTDAVEQLLVQEPPDDAVVVHVTYRDNPFCPAESQADARRLLRKDPDGYAHVWLGEYNTRSAAQVLAGMWRVDAFEPEPWWDGPYQGADFGFAQDPSTLVRCWVAGRRLMVERESWKVGLEIDDTATRWQEDVPGAARYVTRADSARPETISYLKRHGFPLIVPVAKWPGSVEDGIAHLRSYDEIVIHERCVRTQEEARLYRYKVDARSGDVLPVIVDAHNHLIDPIRYALAPLIRRRVESEHSFVRGSRRAVAV